jgi:hypothetical protein
MQPAPPLFRDFYPTYAALKGPFGVLEKRIVRLTWVASSPCGSGADLHQPHWIAIIQTTAVFATKLRFPHSRRPKDLQRSLNRHCRAFLSRCLAEPTNTPASPRGRDWLSVSALAIMHSSRSQIARSAFARIAYLRAIGCDQIPIYSGV